MPLSPDALKQQLAARAQASASGIGPASGGAPPSGGPRGVFDVSNDGATWYPAVRIKASTGAAFVVTNGEAVLTGQNAGMTEYADHAEFRSSPAPADGTVFRIVSPCGEYRYSSSSGAGWADDDDTLLKPDSVNVNDNGRAFTTRASAHAATAAAFRAMKGLVISDIRHVHLESHTTFGDGGGGILDVRAVGAYVDDDGTVFTNSEVAGIRRVDNLRRKRAVWWGIAPGADVTTKVRTFLTASQYGDDLIFGRGRHTISDTIDIENRGLTIIGQGGLDPNPYIDTGTIFIGNFAKPSGAAASIASVSAPIVDTDSRIVVFSGLTGIANVDPGDMIRITGAALERNNGYFTIISVNSGAGTVTCHVYNQFVHTVNYLWIPSIAGETNNGSLAWEIRKPMFRIHNETRFRDVFFNGAETVSVLVDSGPKGATGTPGVGAYDSCTGNRFHGCRWRAAWQGLSIGGFGNYVTGGATDITWASNCDLHLIHDASFVACEHSGICIPSSSGTSVLHDLKFVSISECGLGIACRKGSFKAATLNFAGNTTADILIQGITDPILINGGHSEGTPLFLVVGAFGYFASTSTIIPIQIENFRADSNVALPADNCYMQFGSLGGVAFRNCIFESSIGNANWTIGAQGRATNGVSDLHANANWITFESCVFPISDASKIVTSLAGDVGLNPVWYKTTGCCTVAPGSYVPVGIPDGVHSAYGAPASKAPSTIIRRVCSPQVGSTLANGDNNAASLPSGSIATVTGPTGAVALNGVLPGEDGQIVTWRLNYEQITTVNHLSVSANAGSRLFTPNALPLVLWTPSAGGSNYLSAYYDPDEDTGAGAWVISGFISGVEP